MPPEHDFFDAPERPIRLGVSACLLGERVRYDGGHKRDRVVADLLPRRFTMVPVCPEVAIGLGTPRKAIHLVGAVRAPRAVEVCDGEPDVTDRLTAYGHRMASEMADISGYILKSGSPSCGMERVPIHGNGEPLRKGRGIYAAALMRALPMLPAEEEGRIGDPALRACFIERVYAYRRWQDLVAGGVTRKRLVDFHTRHQLILMAHDGDRAAWLERFLAEAGKRPVAELAEEYGRGFMDALAYPPSRRRHADVLMHLMGYLEPLLDDGDKAGLLRSIDDYRRGLLPRNVPITSLRHHFRRHPDPWVARQLYLTEPVADPDGRTDP